MVPSPLTIILTCPEPEIRDHWARTISPNKDVKVYIGAPASSSAAGGGYQAINTLNSIAVQMRNSFPSFGGVMLWQASGSLFIRLMLIAATTR